MPMLFRAAAAAIVIAVVAGGALFFLRGPASPGVASVPTPSPTPSPSPMSLDAYVAAYNAACDAARVATEPLRPSFLERYDGSITDAQRADWTDALIQLHDRTTRAADELAALAPPPEFQDGHVRTVQDLRDELALVQEVSTALRDRRDADALAADQATQPLGDRIFNWENQHVLHHCP